MGSQKTWTSTWLVVATRSRSRSALPGKELFDALKRGLFARKGQAAAD